MEYVERPNWIGYDPQRVPEEVLLEILSPLEPVASRDYSPTSRVVWIEADISKCDRLTTKIRAIEAAWTDPDAEKKEAERIARFLAYLVELGIGQTGRDHNLTVRAEVFFFISPSFVQAAYSW